MIEGNYILKEVDKKISCEEAIGLLVDNSINASELGGISKKNVKIKIDVTEKRILIQDNCTGINKEKWNDLFILESRNYKNRNGSGLKEAFFRLGKELRITTHNKEFSAMSMKIKPEDIIRNRVRYLGPTEIEKSETGFKIEIQKFRDDFKRYLKRNMQNGLRKYLSRRYRKFIELGIDIILNNNIILKEESEFQGSFIGEFRKSIKGNDVRLTIFNNVLKENNGVSIIVNNKVIEEKTMIKEFKGISVKGTTYVGFHGEIEIESINKEKIGISATDREIERNTNFMDELIKFFKEKIDETRKYFSKEKVTIQFDIENFVFLKAKKLLYEEGVDTNIAKEVGERIFYYGLTMKDRR